MVQKKPKPSLKRENQDSSSAQNADQPTSSGLLVLLTCGQFGNAEIVDIEERL
jgi:hypothetical protein